MDELAAALSGSFSVSNIPNNTAAEHPRYSQYKQRGHETNQGKRRRQILQSQKDWRAEGRKAAEQITEIAMVSRSRFDFMKHVRRLAENMWDELSEEEGDTAVPMEAAGSQKFKPRALTDSGGKKMKKGTSPKPKKQQPSPKKYESYDLEDGADYFRPGRYYKDQLMFSEWMVDIPEDLQTDWVMVPCPVGKRNLVVASSGGTTSYSKGGWKVQSFPCQLPGGCRNMPGWQKDATILDTIYCDITRTYYVLDMMCWREMPLYETDTEFRFFWMHDKLGEMGQAITTTRKNNPYRFEPLPNFDCKYDNIEKVLQAQMKLKLDGLLFFHKKSHYLCGTTPLVLWLKAYMLPDILNIQIPDALMQEKPHSYTTFQAHTEQVKADKEKEEKKAAEREQKRQEKRRSRGGRGNVGGKEEVMETVAETVVEGAVIVAEGSSMEGVLSEQT